MLKRIKETLTCFDSGGGIRAKLKSHHLLHSDKSTYTYFYKGKVRSLLYSPSIPLLGGTALLLVLGLSIGCVGSNKAAYAETVTEEQCNSETKLALSLNGVTGDSVSLSKNVDDDIAAGNISKVSQDFNVIACMVRNYKLYVQAESSMLKNGDVPDALYGVGENVAESDFNENTWGYSVAPKGSTSATYNTVPELAETIPEAYTGTTSTSNTGQDFTITFAAKFGNNKPAGHYTSNVLLSMVAEPKEVISHSVFLGNITKMSEMTSTYCKNLPSVTAETPLTEIPTGLLIDDRDADDKKYWVSKLADGNCWMTQNIAADSVAAVYKPDPSLQVLDGDSLISIADLTLSENPAMTDVMADGRYNGHYLIGNYYNFNQATSACNFEGLGNSSWKVPTAAYGASSPSGSFYYLLDKYGLTQNLTSTVNDITYDIRAFPFFYIYTGSHINNLSVGPANGGTWWSSTKGYDGSTPMYYRLSISTTGVNPMNFTGGSMAESYFGFPVRCVVVSS